MRLGKSSSAWWGPPKKFDPHFEERRISWLELFFDLVYVIAISRITHHLAAHLSLDALLEYTGLFMLIFWGWLNGSLYHDIHGNAGLRTRLMTLWQVMIIAALSVTIDQPDEKWYINTIIVFMIMQVFITYLWWSVGFYDKAHRRYNKPYTILFLLALVLMAVSLYVQPQWLKLILPLVIICNYTPPFIAHGLLRRSSLDLNLSSSMAERLGLFTIIVFGEVVLGVVNGASQWYGYTQGFSAWLNFALSLSIVFALWWIFFTLTSNRVAKKGFINAGLLELLCIPALVSLGLIASCFLWLLNPEDADHSLPMILIGVAIAIFLASVSLIMGLLEYPDIVGPIKKPVRVSLLITALAFIGWAAVGAELKTSLYLPVVIIILIIEIVYLNSLYYALNIEEGSTGETNAAE